MAPSDHQAAFVLVAFLAAFALAAPARGQETLPIFIEFDFGQVKRLKDSPSAAATERKVAQEVAKRFKLKAYQEWFPWDFRAGTPDDFPKIKFILVEDPKMTKWELHIQAFKENGALPEKLGTLSRIVSKPGDREILRRTPRSEEFPGKVCEWLESRFLLPDSGRELQRLMKAVAPLGECRVLAREGDPKTATEAEGTLELDWDKYQYLSQSTFTVLCQEEDQTWIELGSEGGRKPGRYERDGRKGIGIALLHKSWNNKEILDYLPRLGPLSKHSRGRVYLEKYVQYRGGTQSSGWQGTDQ
jgi:hypothetical protein